MSGQGYHLAIGIEVADALLRNDDSAEFVYELLEQMEESTPEFVHGYYKDWDVLHRCLSDGTFDPKGGSYPLNQCFICARLVCKEGSIVNLVTTEAVRDVANSLQNLRREEFEARFTARYRMEYSGSIPKGDLEDYYRKCTELGDFYRRAADEGRAIVFFTDDCLTYFE